MCGRCALKHIDEILRCKFVVWLYGDITYLPNTWFFKLDLSLALIISLTENAWLNREINYPDTTITVPLVTYSPTNFIEEHENINEVKKILNKSIKQLKELDKIINSINSYIRSYQAKAIA
ncbi:MAG: hypothetical protein QW175_07815 [Candidatus Bathyarchaeia archaeon]